MKQLKFYHDKRYIFTVQLIYKCEYLYLSINIKKLKNKFPISHFEFQIMFCNLFSNKRNTLFLGGLKQFRKKKKNE